MTANIMSGENALDGTYYNNEEQTGFEKRASEGQQEFEQMEEQLEQSMQVLSSPEATAEEKTAAARVALGINKKIEEIYAENAEFVTGQADSFEKSTLAFEDQNTQAELDVMRTTIDEYKSNWGLTTQNIEALEQVVSLADNGYTLDITGEVDARGDYTITGEAVKEVAEEEGLDKTAEKTVEDLSQGIAPKTVSVEELS